MRYNLFFELIRVAIGAQESLSRMPSESEWKELYEMAKKQSLVGICFAGVQKMCDSDEEFYFGMSEMQYLVWMGMAAKIQQKNEVVNKQCAVLQKKFSADGFRSCVLKGQGVATLYRVGSKCSSGSKGSSGFNDGTSRTVVTSETFDLSGLRQSGDIDIYVDCGLEKAVAWAKTVQKDVRWDYKHLHLEVFDDTEVEMHYHPEYLANLWHNRIFQKWAKDNYAHAFGRRVNVGGQEIVTPDTFFNSLYVLIHIYNHNFRAGVGLRQLMDYYFVITERVMTEGEISDLNMMFRKLGMFKYVSGIMWIMKELFGMKDEYLICPASENEGRYILDGVMIGGNMGRGYKRSNENLPYAVRFVSDTFRYSFRSFGRYPVEAISYPIWTIYHFVWKRLKMLALT